jgi:hypothetical protein
MLQGLATYTDKDVRMCWHSAAHNSYISLLIPLKPPCPVMLCRFPALFLGIARLKRAPTKDP